MEEIVAAIIGAVISGVTAWKAGRSDLGQKNNLLNAQLQDYINKNNELAAELKETKEQVSSLSSFKNKYQHVKSKLEGSCVVREYSQPVILVGPRFVGKTSLLMQWHSPWDHSNLDPTATHRISDIPIYDFQQKDTEPHFADPDVQTQVNIHLKLRVHDFPGELSSQKSICEQAKEETSSLQRKTKKNLGVVLICMFDAEEAVTEQLSKTTMAYYHGELFANLRELVAYKEIELDRLVLDFNKYDKLKKSFPNQNNESLLKRCLKTYDPIIRLLRGVCSPEKVCEAFTVLDRDDMVYNNRGAPIILGEAARNFVHVMAGKSAVEEVVPKGATSYSASILL